MKTIQELQELAYKINKANGWHSSDYGPSFGDYCSNFHAEISEAFEDYKNGRTINEIYYEGKKPCGIPVELADIVIRVMDFCEHNGIPLGKIIEEKLEYNKTRGYRHGGKVI